MQAVKIDLGLVDYRECYELQSKLLEMVASGTMEDVLLLVEHPPVYSLGANFHAENLPFPPEFYQEKGVAIEPTNRGGDITYHGPGQLVAYPIFDLNRYGKDLHKWLRNLEQTVIELLYGYGLSGRRFPPNTGVWIDDEKLCAIGIKVRRWVSMHGIALNVENDLSPFQWIVPCGIKGYEVTSLSKVLGRTVPLAEVKQKFVEAMQTVFPISLKSQDSVENFDWANRLSSTDGTDVEGAKPHSSRSR